MSILKDSWLTTIFTGATTSGDKVSATTMNVTKIVSFFVALFGGITQWLTSANQIELTTGQMVIIWLVVAGLIVLIGITDMACRAYVTAKTSNPPTATADLSQLGIGVSVAETATADAARRPGELLDVFSGGGKEFAHVKIDPLGNPYDEWVEISRVHKN